jgi:hypothetical protein
MRNPAAVLAVAIAVAPRAAWAGDIGSTPVSIAVPGMVFLMVLGIVITAFYVGDRETRQKQETLRLAIEKGVALPPGLVEPVASPERDLRKGIRLIFVGLGVGVLLYFVAPYRSSWAVGAMIGIFGLGHLVSWWLTRRSGPPVPPAVP